MDVLRLFIAIELDDDLRRALGDIQKRFKSEPAAKFVRWVAQDGIHLTLKFLGDVSPARVPQLVEAVERAAEDSEPFSLTARGLGCFPNLTRPKVIWVGVEGAVENARILAQRIEEECALLGFERDLRGFTPHLTLGRVKRDIRSSESKQVGEMVQRLVIEEVGQLKVDKLYLMQSDLRSDGAVYSVRGLVDLKRVIQAKG